MGRTLSGKEKVPGGNKKALSWVWFHLANQHETGALLLIVTLLSGFTGEECRPRWDLNGPGQRKAFPAPAGSV